MVVECSVPRRRGVREKGNHRRWYEVEFGHGVLLECVRDADGSARWLGAGKTVARNLPVVVDLLQDEQFLVAFVGFIACGLNCGCPR